MRAQPLQERLSSDRLLDVLPQRLARRLDAKIRGRCHLHEGPLELVSARLKGQAGLEKVVALQDLADPLLRNIEGAGPKGQLRRPTVMQNGRASKPNCCRCRAGEGIHIRVDTRRHIDII